MREYIRFTVHTRPSLVKRDEKTSRRRDNETTRRRDDKTTRRRDDEKTRRQDDKQTKSKLFGKLVQVGYYSQELIPNSPSEAYSEMTDGRSNSLNKRTLNLICMLRMSRRSVYTDDLCVIMITLYIWWLHNFNWIQCSIECLIQRLI
jgi:hypothetical protein